MKTKPSFKSVLLAAAWILMACPLNASDLQDSNAPKKSTAQSYDPFWNKDTFACPDIDKRLYQKLYEPCLTASISSQLTIAPVSSFLNAILKQPTNKSWAFRGTFAANAIILAPVFLYDSKESFHNQTALNAAGLAFLSTATLGILQNPKVAARACSTIQMGSFRFPSEFTQEVFSKTLKGLRRGNAFLNLLPYSFMAYEYLERI